MAIIIWIIIIMIIVAVTQKPNKKREISEKEFQKVMEKKYQNTNSSYYSKQKQEQYRKMNEMHKNHEEPIDDVCGNIGYKKCPKCNTTVSKKSKVCFMCDYEFDSENAKKPQE